MMNVIFVVWRESLEAMLVIGVLLAWIARQPDQRKLRSTLWAGVSGGVLLALFLATLAYGALNLLNGNSLEIFQLLMLFGSAALMLEMVAWMRQHGRNMKRHLEENASRATQGRYGLAAVAALAIGREGAETIVFLYGLGMESHGPALGNLGLSGAAGVIAAAMTVWLAARGARFLNYRALFRISEILLLLIACALIGSGMDRVSGLDWLPLLNTALWDSSALLDDAAGGGRLLADFAGYRAQPSAALMLAYLMFWGLTWWRLGRVKAAA